MNIFRLWLGFVLLFNSIIIFGRNIYNIPTDTLINNTDTMKTRINWLLSDRAKNPKTIRWVLFPAYNDNDGFMPGVSISNAAFKNPKKLTFAATPLYSIKNLKLVGQLWINYDQPKSKGTFSKISYRSGIKSFDYNTNEKFDYSQRYIRIDPSLTFHFRHTTANEIQSHLSLKSYFIIEEDAVFNSGVFSGLDSKHTFIQRLEFKRYVTDELQTSDLKVSLEYQGYVSQNYLKMTAITDQRYLFAPKKNLYFRLFASGFILNSQRRSGSYQNIFTRGSIALIHQGFNDYTYDEYFFSRQNQSGFQDDQVSLSQGGGFKTPLGSAYSIGMSNHFAAALNFSCDLPFKLPQWIPLRVYFDVGSYSTHSGAKFVNNVLYNGGLSLNYKDIAAVHLPLVFSKDLGDLYKGSHKDLLSRLSFTINLHKLDFWTIQNRF